MKPSPFLVDILSPGARAIGGSSATVPPMPRHEIDPSDPLASLRAAAGIGGEPLPKAELARARGVAKPTQHGAEKARGAISIDMFRAYAESLGGRVTITVDLPGPEKK